MDPKLIVIIGLIVIVFAALSALASGKKKPNDKKITYPYEKIDLLTKNELKYYKILLEYAEKNGLQLIAKTRIADIVGIKKGTQAKERQTAFNRINAKHIDFILCEKTNLAPKVLIEIDDSTHDKEKTKARDEFIENLYKITEYTLIRVRSTEEIKEKLDKIAE